MTPPTVGWSYNKTGWKTKTGFFYMSMMKEDNKNSVVVGLGGNMVHDLDITLDNLVMAVMTGASLVMMTIMACVTDVVDLL